MGKFLKFFLSALLLAGAVFFLIPVSLPGGELPHELPGRYQRQVRRELLQARSLLESVPADRDAREDALAQGGFSVINSDAVYPAYLEHHEPLTDFWNAISAGRDSSLSLFRVLEDGSLRHLLFLCREGETLFFTTDAAFEGSSLRITGSSVLPVYDMELSDWGIFYYQVYPANDPHYVDYAQIRMEAADKAQYDLARAYILPVGYQMVNLFLCDWQEGDWGNLSFHDLLEFLSDHHAGTERSWEQYSQYPREGGSVRIPAVLFESAILPYFSISREELRSHCGYDADSSTYPWRPVRGDDLVTWSYPMCEPEVTNVSENADGTITLEVQVYSPELKTDRLFCHTLTVRPLEEGRFQYVSNRITYISDQGLPFHMPRFTLAD